MAKYIIELERGETAYKTVNSNGKPMIQLLAPTPYTEPDTEKIRKEAYDKGFDAGRTLNTGKYEKGLDDAWECARKIVDCAIPYEALENYLEIGECTADVIKHLPASKAIEVVRQYEQEKEEIIDPDKNKVEALANDIGIHKLFALVKEIRGE